MPKTLLLADDSVTIQKVVGISFANEDVVLLTVDNGDDAIAKAREARPDLVLADVVMPGKSGYEVCEAVKGDANLAGVPVLLLTGTFEAFDEDRAQRVGADGHITKPFEAQALVDQVNALLARSAAPAAVAPASNADSMGQPAEGQSVEFFDDEATAPGTTQPGAAAGTGDDLGLSDSGGQSFRFDDTPDLGSALEAPPEASSTPAPFDAGDETRILPAGTDLVGSGDTTVQGTPDGELEAEPVFDALDETSPPTPPGAASTLDPAQASAYDVSSTDLGPLVAPAQSAAPPAPAMASAAAPPIPNGDETLLVSEPLVAAPEPPPAPVASPPPIPEPPAAPMAPPPVPQAPAPPALEAAPPVPEPVLSAPRVDVPQFADSQFAEPQTPIAEPQIQERELPVPEPVAAPLAPSTPPATAPPGTELPAALREEIRATLEKVAWEAFGRVTESVVKDAVERIEKVAWEVVPQLAETLVKEEIRKLKDD